MIYKHWRDAPWDSQRWPNFKPYEYACNHCGQLYWDPVHFDMMQAARTDAGIPFRLNSGHRCRIWNAKVGGAPLSMHKKMASDVAITGSNKAIIYRSLKKAGFTTFGFYGTFIHTDRRKGRRWSTAAGRSTWSGLVTF